VTTVAITGGIGAGKSEALKAFERHGAAVSSSDQTVHRLFGEDAEVRAALRDRFGEEIFDADGELDRPRLGRIVFADRDQLTWLEELLHPRVVREDLAWRERLLLEPRPPTLIVTEVPLLYETGGERRFDKVVAVTAPEMVRAARTKVRADGRSARLLPDAEKIRRADFAFVNDGSLEALDQFVIGVIRTIGQDPSG